MRCPRCGSEQVGERPERTALGYRRFRCRGCGKQSNERSGTALNRTQYPADVIALVVQWRLRCQLSLRDLAEMFLARGLVFSHEAVVDSGARRNRPVPLSRKGRGECASTADRARLGNPRLQVGDHPLTSEAVSAAGHCLTSNSSRSTDSPIAL
jgi:transposase-like protein